MIKMKALKAHRYGSERKVGDLYEVKTSDLRLVKALGWSKEAPDEPAPAPVVEAPVRRAYVRKDVVKAFEHSDTDNRTTEQVSDHIKAENAPAEKPKRTYKRRDMTAE